jgi:uncharacterized damage-inducible protein DinB
MNLTPDQATLIANYLAADAAVEAKTTRAVIASIPAGQEGYAPDGKSMNALKLAWHIASAEWWFLDCITKGEFRSGDSAGMPEEIKSATDVLNWYDANVPPAWEKAKAMTGEDLSKELDFFGMWNTSAANYLTLTLKHSIHHRGQLSAYLRPMGAKVPGIYGPSGDSN